MILHKVLSQRLMICLALGIIVVVQLLVSSNPDGVLPVVPELVSIAILSGILYIAFRPGKTLQPLYGSFRRSECLTLGLLWFSVLFITGLRAFWSLLHTPHQIWIPCRTIPGIAPKVECLMQASITQHYGFRTFFMLITAVMLGTLAYLIARSIYQGWKLLLGAVVFGPLLVTVVGLWSLAFGIEQVLSKSLFHNAFGTQRFTQIVGNPGWVWPYFAPGLAIVLWATVSVSSRAGRIFYAGISIVLLFGALATQQRGALLLCSLYIAVCAVYCLTCGLKKKSIPFLSVGGTVLAVLCSGIYSTLNNPKLLQESSQSMGYGWKSSPLSFDVARFEIWKAAWEIFQQAPVFGHGYASWFQLISDYGQRHNMIYVFDTAHNLLLQMLVELGLIHTLLVLSILVLIALCVYQNSRFLPGRSLLFLLAASSFLVPVFIQEINYIRSTFYIHAIFWGTLAGLPFYDESLSPLDKPRQQERVSRYNLWLRSKRFTPSVAFAVLTGASVVGILFCALNFNWGGQAFTAYLAQPNLRIMRWLSPSVALTSFATTEGKAYSVYESVPFQKPMSVHWGGASSFRLTVDGPDELSLVLENGGRYWPKRHYLSFAPAYPDNTRWISVAAFYPPQQSNLGISWSRNMYPWETSAGRAGRWCGQDCAFLVNSCGRRDLDFAVQAPRPDYSEAKPLYFDISVYSLVKGREFSTWIWQTQDLPKPMLQGREQLKKLGEEKRFHFNGTPETAWYVVRLQAESVFNPKSQGLSLDDRNLALFVSEVDCSTAHP